VAPGKPEPTRPRELGEVLAEFAAAMADQPTVEDILCRLGDYCSELLPTDAVGVLLRDMDGGLRVATANDDLGWAVERLEVDLAEGPCTDSLRSGEQILAPDLAAHDERYPTFVPAALEAGARSIHALPMTARMEPVGALDLIARDPVALTANHLTTAQVLADVAIAYLVNTRIYEEKSRLAEQLQEALDSRVLIEQVKGVLAERHGIPLNDAFTRVRTYARQRGLKLRVVAEQVLRQELDV
jgi:transcriptional regulator with GAF, ATPase, and Fis domain